MTTAGVAGAPAAGCSPAQLPGDPLDAVPSDAVVAVAMSGGVDSSVAAARCVSRGLRTMGITLAMWPRAAEMTRDRGCCSVDAVADARRVCSTLGIPHYPWNLEDSFRDEVIADFEDLYATGRTPNPCVRCNDRIKFGALLDRARAVGATHLATGHYARIGRRGDRLTLHRGADPVKDQAYTLYSLGQRRLAAAVFPIGALASKRAVRAEAAGLGLVTASKPDSQELCFVDGTVRQELGRRLAGRYRRGTIVDGAGRRIGEHRGLPFYTVGQRAGLGIEPASANARARYVVGIDGRRNQLVVGPREALRVDHLEAAECRWIAGEPLEPGRRCAVQVRAHGTAHPATVEEATSAGRLLLRLDPPADRVAPGQAVVVVDGDEILGGGAAIDAAP